MLEEESKLRVEIEQLLEAAQATDEQEDQECSPDSDGYRVSDELARREQRLEKIEEAKAALEERGNLEKFDKLLAQCSWLLASSFLLSAVLNYILARAIVTTEPALNKALYNEEVGKMMGWSFPVIAVPCMLITIFVLWRLFAGIRHLSGLNPEDLVSQKSPKE